MYSTPKLVYHRVVLAGSSNRRRSLAFVLLIAILIGATLAACAAHGPFAILTPAFFFTLCLAAILCVAQTKLICQSSSLLSLNSSRAPPLA